MAESTPKRVGKFTIVSEGEEAKSSTGSILGPETASKESADQKSASDSLEPFTLKTSQSRRRTSTRQPKAPPTVVGQIAEAPADYRLWSQIFIGSANTVVVTWLGTECAMEKREAEMIEPPLARMLSRMPVGTSQKMAVFIDPMVLLIAMGMWGNRIIRIQRAKKGNGITDVEFARASGMAPVPPIEEAPTVQEYEPSVEPDFSTRTRVPVNPNGIPTAITSQMSEL
jgi:hypothetical protein